MKLNNKGLENKNAWEAAGYALPQYDREAVAARTKQNPFWIHFGAGNIFRAFQANVVQDLLNKGDLDRGLVVAEGYDYEILYLDASDSTLIKRYKELGGKYVTLGSDAHKAKYIGYGFDKAYEIANSFDLKIFTL